MVVTRERKSISSRYKTTLVHSNHSLNLSHVPDVDGRGGAAETEVSSGARRVEAAAIVAEPGDGSTPDGVIAQRLAL